MKEERTQRLSLYQPAKEEKAQRIIFQPSISSKNKLDTLRLLGFSYTEAVNLCISSFKIPEKAVLTTEDIIRLQEQLAETQKDVIEKNFEERT